jgi:hypothetical protein
MLSSGAIVGIVIGSIVGLIVIALLLYRICFRRHRKQATSGPGVYTFSPYTHVYGPVESDSASAGLEHELVDFGSMQVKGIREVRGEREGV